MNWNSHYICIRNRINVPRPVNKRITIVLVKLDFNGTHFANKRVYTVQIVIIF